MTVDVVIPTFRPDDRLWKLLESLFRQQSPIRRVVLMNTEQKYFENLVLGKEYQSYQKYIDVKHISRLEFDHGMTRNAGAQGSDADYILFMTQDALPKNDNLVTELLGAFTEDEQVAVSYARQIPTADATLAEQFSRYFNYPPVSVIKSKEDIETMGIKAFFCSNACAMYKREVFESLGGFPKNMIFNEDMVYARKALDAGYKIAYASAALVVHSHNYSNAQQFHRNFDLAVSQAMHPETFGGISSESEGIRYVKAAFTFFLKKGRPFMIVPFGITCVYRFVGFRLGKRYKRLSHRRILKYTMSPVYFKKLWS